VSLFKRSSTRASTAAGLPIEPIRQVWGTRYDSDFVGNDDGRHVEIDGWLLWADEETSERVEDLSHFPDICTSKLAGGTHHQAQLSMPLFDLGQILIIQHVPFEGHVEACEVFQIVNKTKVLAGYLPHDVAAVLAPALDEHPYGSVPAIVYQTFSADGMRVGLRLLFSLTGDPQLIGLADE
jgi:hypothetical protein